MVKLKELTFFLGDRNANIYSTREKVEANFNIPKGSLSPKFYSLFDRIKSFENTLIFGARGVGKTLYLKKAKFDYLYSNEGILPLYVDLSHVRELLKTASQMNLDYPTRKNLFHFYLRYLIISEITKFYEEYIETRNKSLWKRFSGLFRLISEIYRIKSPDVHDEEIKDRINQIRRNCEKPFDLVNIKPGRIEFKSFIKNLESSPKFKELVDHEFYEILTIISERSNFNKFLLILDEFSMLTEEGQNLLAPLIIDIIESPYSRLEIKCKISVMEGRFHVDTANFNFSEHGFNDLHFELEFKGIFSGVAADDRLSVFYGNILTNRLKDKLGRKSPINLFEDKIAFRNLCLFSGFKVRDFLAFMSDICNENEEKEKISQTMVYEICYRFYRKQLPSMLKKVSTELIANYLRKLSEELKSSNNKFYFTTEDFNENFFQIMIYFKILSFVSYSKRHSSNSADSRGFLIDLSTALQYNIISRSKLKSGSFKYLNFTDAIRFNFSHLDKNTIAIVLNLLDLGLTDDQILSSVPGIIQRDLNELKQKKIIDNKYSSEDLVEEDKQVDEDEKTSRRIDDLADLKYISLNLATILNNLEVTRSIFLKWSKIDLENISKHIPTNFRSTLSRAYNFHHK